MKHPLSLNSFQLSILSLAIFTVQQSVAAAAPQSLATIQLEATVDLYQSSEQSKSYIQKKSSTASKLNLDIRETPQTVNVVTRQQLDDFAITDAREALRNTPGISVTNQETERTTYMARGFEISNILTDGIGFPLDSSNYVSENPDLFFYDRIEVSKGADALNNGVGDPSATINMIRKRPTEELQVLLNTSYGSWNTQRFEADISSKLTEDGRIRGRLFGYQQTGDSYLDHYSSEKNGFGLILDADITDSTTMTLGYNEANNDPNGNNWGANPLINKQGGQINYDRSYNYSPAWTHWDHNKKSYFLEIEQKLMADWSLNLSLNEKRNERQSKLLFLSGNPDGNNTSNVYLWPGQYFDNNKEQLININTKGTFPAWGQNHEVTFGYSWSKSNNDDLGYGGAYTTPFTTDLASWTPKEPIWNLNQTSGEQHTKKKHQSIYAATRLHINDDLKVILGGNYIQAESEGTSYGSNMIYDENKFVPYTGITFNFTPEYTGYLNYSSIFRPQTTKNANGNINDPIEGDSYEAGLKSTWLDDQLTATMAIFRLEQSNYSLKNSDGIPTERTTQVTDMRSQGYEFSLAGQLTDDVNLSFGYTQFSLKDLINGGDARSYNPTQMFNLLTTYQPTFLPKLKLGLALQWQDKTQLNVAKALDPQGNVTQQAGVIRQDAYALVNLMANYEFNPQFSIQANGYNITNEKYLFNYPDAQGFYGAPANYSVAFKFKYK